MILPFSLTLLTVFFVLSWYSLETGILLTCALLPSYLIRFSLFRVPTTFLEIMILILGAIWIIKKKTYQISRKTWKTSTFIFISILLVLATIGIVVSPDKHAAFGVWKAYYLEPILLFFIIRDITQSKEQINRIFAALGVSALFVSLFGLIQFLFRIGLPSPWDLEGRITSVFDYPNALALFLEPIIVISWFQIEKQKSFFWISVSLLSTCAVFLAQSEAGIATLLFTGILFLLSKKKWRAHIMISIAILALLAFAVPSVRTYLAEKATFADSSEHVRLSQWKETGQLLKDYPIFGAGLSGYPIIMKAYHQDLRYEIFQYPHSILLNIWVELGVLGVILFLAAIFRATMYVAQTQTDTGMKNLFFLLLIEILLHGLVDVPYFKNDLAAMTWILLACASVAYAKRTTTT